MDGQWQVQKRKNLEFLLYEIEGFSKYIDRYRNLDWAFVYHEI
jgi:hypothetical protein